MTRSTSPAPRTGRTWKATVAVGAAVALLAAGGATFAEWSDSTTADSAASITSGRLTIDSPEAGSWTNSRGENVTERIANGAYRIVPGDSLTYSETMTVTAEGDLLSATLSTNLNELTGDAELIAQLTDGATMELNGKDVGPSLATVVSPQNGTAQTLDVSVTVAFDAATESLLAQGKTVGLADMDVLLKQNSVTQG